MSAYQQSYPPMPYPDYSDPAGFRPTPPPGVQVQPGMGYPQPMVRPDHPDSMTVLVISIIGIVGMFFMSPIAWYMGNKSLRDCATGQYNAPMSLRAGRVLGIIGTIALFVSIVLGILLFYLMLVAFSQHP